MAYGFSSTAETFFSHLEGAPEGCVTRLIPEQRYAVLLDGKAQLCKDVYIPQINLFRYYY